jgi:chromosomal replication initiation ATPase DnaA
VPGAKIREISNARMSAMVLIRQHTTMSLKSIGKAIGGRDHTAIIYASATVPNHCDVDANFKSNFKKLEHDVQMIFNPTRALENRFEEYRYAFI